MLLLFRFSLFVAVFVFLCPFSLAQPIEPPFVESPFLKVTVPSHALVGEPITATVSVTNPIRQPMSLGFLPNALSVWVTHPDGTITGDPYNECGDGNFILQPGQTLWQRYSLILYGIDRPGIYKVRVTLYGWDLVTEQSSSIGATNSPFAQIEVSAPTGADADALRWLRLMQEHDTAKIESAQMRQYECSLIGLKLYSNSAQVARLFPTSRYGDYARLYWNDGESDRYSSRAYLHLPMDRAALEKILRVYRSAQTSNLAASSREDAAFREMRLLFLMGDRSSRAIQLYNLLTSNRDDYIAQETRRWFLDLLTSHHPMLFLKQF